MNTNEWEVKSKRIKTGWNMYINVFIYNVYIYIYLCIHIYIYFKIVDDTTFAIWFWNIYIYFTKGTYIHKVFFGKAQVPKDGTQW